MSELLHELTKAFLANDQSAPTASLLRELLFESQSNSDPEFVSKVREREQSQAEEARAARVAELQAELAGLTPQNAKPAPVQDGPSPAELAAAEKAKQDSSKAVHPAGKGDAK